MHVCTYVNEDGFKSQIYGDKEQIIRYPRGNGYNWKNNLCLPFMKKKNQNKLSLPLPPPPPPAKNIRHNCLLQTPLKKSSPITWEKHLSLGQNHPPSLPSIRNGPYMNFLCHFLCQLHVPFSTVSCGNYVLCWISEILLLWICIITSAYSVYIPWSMYITLGRSIICCAMEDLTTAVPLIYCAVP